MKKLIYLTFFICTAFFLTNCGEDEPTPGDDKGDPSDTTDTEEPIDLTPEEHKAALQSIGVEFVNEMALLQESTTSQSLFTLGTLIVVEDEDETPTDGRVEIGKINKRILALTQGKITPTEFAQAPYEEDPGAEDEGVESIEQLFNDAKGVYDWNSTLEDWDITEGGSVVEFNFPSEEGGSTNNCTLTLREYTGVVISNPIDEEYTGDLPASLLMDLYVDGTKEMEYSFDIKYSSEGEPEQVDTELFMNPFSIAVSLTNNEQTVGTQLTLKNGDKMLIDVDTDVNGNFDDETIEGVETSEDPTDVVKDGSVSVSLLNLNLTATLDFEGLYNEVGDIAIEHDKYDEGEPTEDFEANAELLEAALNKYGKLSTSYVDTKGKIAEAEWYTYVEEDEYEIDIELGARMVFEDGSKVDIEDYFESGFSTLESEINDLLDQIGNDIGEDVENVDFD